MIRMKSKRPPAAGRPPRPVYVPPKIAVMIRAILSDTVEIHPFRHDENFLRQEIFPAQTFIRGSSKTGRAGSNSTAFEQRSPNKLTLVAAAGARGSRSWSRIFCSKKFLQCFCVLSLLDRTTAEPPLVLDCRGGFTVS